MSYLLFLVLIFIVSGILAKPLVTSNTIFLPIFYNQFTRLALTSITLFALVVFLAAYLILDTQLSQIRVFSSSAVDLTYFFRLNAVQESTMEVLFITTPKFFFPFFFIFIFITMFSIYFCLAYSAHESVAFIGYCLTILTSGFVLLFTDSFIIFFLAYEGLLVPSFLILYKFAKTRRCIEAAYLMFFWTQFGALFLIFAFLYIFTLTGSVQFAALDLYCFSQFETNFIFALLLIGFGVKIPV
jgi:formate hydrogenlyase subunit 3/multisubunit Na+/H+ antiporter MnhD subunit